MAFSRRRIFRSGFSLSMLILLASVCSSCRSPNESEEAATNKSCKVTYSGAFTGSHDCMMFINKMSSVPSPYVGGGTRDGTFGFSIMDVPVSIGQYSTSDTNQAIGILNDGVFSAGKLPRQWNLAIGPNARANKGEYQMQIKALSRTESPTGVEQWDIDGTLDATFIAEESTGATGTVAIHMEF